MIQNLIYDIGMHNGDDTRYYLSLGYNVIAIDASPDLVNKAISLFKEEINKKQLEVLNLGIAPEEGFLDFYLNKHDSVWNSFDKNAGSRGGKGFEIIKVKTQRLDQLISERGVPYYLKMDIEGYDKISLASLFNSIERPAYLSVELYDLELIIILGRLGYTKFKIIDQPSLLPLEIPLFEEYRIYKNHFHFKTSMNIFIRVFRKLFGRIINRLFENRYRKWFNYNHPFGSSGPFGRNLPGKWHNLDEIKEIFVFYKNDFEKSKGVNNNGWWIDIHATT